MGLGITNVPLFPIAVMALSRMGKARAGSSCYLVVVVKSQPDLFEVVGTVNAFRSSLI